MPTPPEDRNIDIDPPGGEPRGIEDVKDMRTTIGAAASGNLMEEDDEQARLRLYDAQVILAELGYLRGEHGDLEPDITGVWDPDTRDAIAAFQDEHGLEESGQLDAKTYEALLAEHELALGTRDPVDRPDDFSPVHANEPVYEQPLASDEGKFVGREEEAEEPEE